MNTGMWGPSDWRFFDGLSSGYPLSTPSAGQRCAMERFVMAMGRTYACIYCRESSFKFIRSADVSLEKAAAEGRDAMRRWFSARHDDVNNKLGKPLWGDGTPLPPPPSKEETRRAAAVALLAVAYNYPAEPPADTKSEDFYRLWFHAIPDANDAVGQPLGPGLREELAGDPLTEEALASRQAVVAWTLRRFPEWSRIEADVVIGKLMRARPGGCKKSGCV